MEWREVVGSKGEYMISDTGIVKTVKSGRILKRFVDERGYERVPLFKMDRKRHFRIHRLVAQAFIPNPNNLPQVNHKDGNKRNNCIDNLEWITNVENMRHAKKMGLRVGHEKFCERKSIRVVATNIETGERIEFDSILAAKKCLKAHVTEVLRGKRKQSKGYVFDYGDAI